MAEALVWGASGGIGAALSTQLRERGWRVFAAARQEHKVPQGVDAVYSFAADDPFSFDAVAMAVAQESEGLDLAIYAAGAMDARTLSDSTLEQWRSVQDANLTGVLLAAKASLNLLRDGGCFVAVGAHVDKISLPRFGAYAAAKAALEPMMGVLAKEQRKHRFLLVRPGAVDTPFWQNVPFKVPSGAASAASVATAILTAVEEGKSGAVDV